MQNIQWSYSGLKDYINCPRQYNEVKVLKRFEKKQTAQMTFGTKVHEELENFVKGNVPLSSGSKKYESQLTPLRDMDGVKYPEHRMALTEDLQPCDFFDSNFWVRGIADLLVVEGDHAFIVDYKTGNYKYADPKQLQLMALMAFEHFPQIEHVDAGLLFVVHNKFFTSEYSAKDKQKLWGDFQGDLLRLSHSYESDTWQANPSGLCGWCPVKTCEFHKER